MPTPRPDPAAIAFVVAIGAAVLVNACRLTPFADPPLPTAGPIPETASNMSAPPSPAVVPAGQPTARGGGPGNGDAAQSDAAADASHDAGTGADAGAGTSGDDAGTIARPAATQEPPVPPTTVANAPPPEAQESQGGGPAEPQPVRQPALRHALPGGSFEAHPPAHPGQQPVIAVLDDRCDRTERACDPSTEMFRGYGWTLCLRDRRTCTPSENAAPDRLLNAAWQEINARGAGSVLPNSGVLVTRGVRVRDLAAILGHEPNRWPYVLIIDPPTGDRAPEAATPGSARRIAFVYGGRRGELKRLLPTARRLRGPNSGVAWFAAPASDTAARDAAIRRALVWLLVGPDSKVCPPEPPAEARGRRRSEPPRVMCETPEAPRTTP